MAGDDIDREDGRRKMRKGRGGGEEGGRKVISFAAIQIEMNQWSARSKGSL